MAKPKEPRTFHTKVVGVTFKNPDGAKRQDIIERRCYPGDELGFVPEPENPHADHAVAVFVLKRRWFGGVKSYQIGYLSDDTGIAADMFRHIQNRRRIGAAITEVTGGTRKKPTRGVNIEITIYPAE